MDGFGTDELLAVEAPDIDHRPTPSGCCVPLDQRLRDLLYQCFKDPLTDVRTDMSNVLMRFGFFDLEACAGVANAIAGRPATEAERALLEQIVGHVCGSTGTKNALYQRIVNFFDVAAKEHAKSSADTSRAEEARKCHAQSALALHLRLSTLHKLPDDNKKAFAAQLLTLFFGSEAQKDSYLPVVKVDDLGRPRCPWVGCKNKTHFAWQFPSLQQHHLKLITHIAKMHFDDASLALSGSHKRPVDHSQPPITAIFKARRTEEPTPSSASSSASPLSCL